MPEIAENVGFVLLAWSGSMPKSFLSSSRVVSRPLDRTAGEEQNDRTKRD